jgi:Zn-dependent protease with chaperone function
VSFEPRLPDDRVNVSGTNPLAEAGLLVGGLVAVVVAIAVASSLVMVPTSLEVRVFGGGWLARLGSDDAEEEAPDRREASLQALVDRLARHWPENPYEFKPMLWQEESPNAFALPGGWIGVTTGLIAEVDSENELAFVLGHEIGHFRNRDHLKGLGRGLALGIVLSAVGLSGVGAAADLAGLAGGLAQRSFDREQESDADEFGLGVVAAEYGHVGGAAEFFRRMPDVEGLLGEKVEAYLSTHPISEERIQELAAYAGEQGFAREGELIALPEDLLEADDATSDERED